MALTAYVKNIIQRALGNKVAADSVISHLQGDVADTLESPTIENSLTIEVATVAAAGTNQGTATALTGAISYDVTAGDGTKGVVLPTAVAGKVIEVYNNSASNLKVYPNTSDDINDGTVNVHVTLAANNRARFTAVDATTWSASYSAGGTNVTLTGAEELTNKTMTAQVVKTGLTASGSAANDFSASTGTFLTSSGANTISGTATVAANKNLLCAAGTSLLDFSLGTGIFKSPSGANTLSGDVAIAAGKDVTYETGDGLFDASLGTGIFKTTTGLNTFGGKAAFKVIAAPVAATGAGGGVAGAAALGSANIVAVSSDGATKGVKFVTGVAGDVVHVINTTATACNLFAASGGTINGGGADVGCAIPASKGVVGICTAADTWIVMDMTARAGAAA